MAHEHTGPHGTVAGDVWGGLASMLVALPSSIAFGVAIFASLGTALSPQGALAGILGATVLGLLAPLCGGSTRLITAPCAPAAAMLSALAITFARHGTPAPAVLLLLGLIGLFSGFFQIGLGLSGVGRLIRFIPYPVVSGYLSGVGLVIIGSQIPNLLGVPHGTKLIAALGAPSSWTWQSMVVGTVVIAVMVGAPRLIRIVPAAILALVAGMATYAGLGLAGYALLGADHNPLLVGAITGGDAAVADMVGQRWRALNGLGVASAVKVIVPALTLAVLLSIDTLKTCVVVDAMTESHHNSNRELIGQGLANIASAVVGGVPGSGTMGASMINIASGGTTRLSGLMAGVFSFVAYLILSPVIAWVPVAALAGILMVVGFRMIDRHSLAFFFTPETRLDFLVIVAVIAVALFGDLIVASGIGMALSILLFTREQTRSSVIRSRVEGSQIFSRRARAKEYLERLGENGNDVVVFELQGSLFFGTASQLYAALEPETATRRYVILSMRRVQSLDVTATHVLEQIKDRLERNGAYLVFCDIPKGLPSGLKMKHFLKATGVVRPTSKAFAFHRLEEALEWVEARELDSVSPEPVDPPALAPRDMPIFRGQSAEAMAALEAAMTLRTIKAGHKLFKFGAPGGEMFLIHRGLIKVTQPLHKKEDYHLATCGPGEILGAVGFLDSGGHASDGLALTDTEVYVLSHDRFEDLAARYGSLSFAVMQCVASGLAHRLQAAVGELQAMRG